MNSPKISIVTPSLNQGFYIEETILSVLEQNYSNLEYIIIDGGSTDNSVEIIKKYEKYLTYWISEKDNGQANAINKGLNVSTGSIFNWLNSDDYLQTGALELIATAFANEQVHMVAGKVRNFLIDTEEIIPNQNLSAKGLMCWQTGVKFVQPGVWMRRDLIEQCGGIDEKFHYAFDWDLYIRYLYCFPQVKELNELLVHFRLHTNSKTESHSELFTIEERKIIEKLYKLPAFKELHDACNYKIQKTGWTEYLSQLSKKDISFLKKLLATVNRMSDFPRVCYSRQTVGALKAFWDRRDI